MVGVDGVYRVVDILGRTDKVEACWKEVGYTEGDLLVLGVDEGEFEGDRPGCHGSWVMGK